MSALTVAVGQDDIVGPWVTQRSGGTFFLGRGVTIGICKDDNLIGGFLFEDYNGNSVIVHIASDGNKHFLTKEIAEFVSNYVFHQLKVKVVIAPIASYNEDALKLAVHAGFVENFRIADAAPKDGDIVILTLRPENCDYFTLRQVDDSRAET